MVWDVDPFWFRLGDFGLRYYTVLFVAGVGLCYWHTRCLFKRDGLDVMHLNRMSLWIVLGLLIGAHVVHLVFYEPHAFINDPMRILELGSGLASHGGVIGAVLAAWLYCRKYKQPFLKYVDRIAVSVFWIVICVRLGNFFNSEIVGRPTELPWGVEFVRRGLMEPRHPSQLYESSLGLLLLVGLWGLEARYRRIWSTGAFFYTALSLYLVTRFLVEFLKESQGVQTPLPLTMGQMLTLPMLLGSLWLLRRTFANDAPSS